MCKSNDYISKEKVCEFIAEFINHDYSTDAECELLNIIIDGIKHLPSVKQEQKTEHEIREEYSTDFHNVCRKVGK